MSATIVKSTITRVEQDKGTSPAILTAQEGAGEMCEVIASKWMGKDPAFFIGVVAAIAAHCENKLSEQPDCAQLITEIFAAGLANRHKIKITVTGEPPCR